LRDLVSELRDRLPPLLPVRVYVRALSDCLGYTELRYDKRGRPSHFNIVIGKGSRQVQWQVLIHEWAHALCWTEGEDVCHHGPEWGLAVSRVYQEVIEP